MTKQTKRFWSKVKKTSGCWEWTGCRNGGGYGTTNAGGKWKMAHRLSYSLKNGKIPDGMWVLHRCDNRGCVRPGHLFLGDRFDNARDCSRKGRHGSHTHPHLRRGVLNGRHKLNEILVIKIRAEYTEGKTSYKKLAAKYGVCLRTMAECVTRSTWKHISP